MADHPSAPTYRDVVTPQSSAPVHLRRTDENVPEIARLAARFGGTVGLAPVLDSLNRKGTRATVPGSRVAQGFAWNESDATSRRWWPQGITTSADAAVADDDRVGGRRLLVTSWYSKQLSGESHGSRITFVDVDTLEYRHVLLVLAEESFGETRMKALTVHAGGLVWHGPYLHVAGTRRGLLTCRLDDIIEVTPGPESFGHRYVLPVRFTYEAVAAPGTEKLRYSFLSLDRGSNPPALVAGEYGVDEQTHRLARFPFDPRTHHLHATEEGLSYPTGLDEQGGSHMQGAAVVGDTWYVTTSRGPRRNGQLLVGHPGAFQVLRRALPPGPEDITYWPATDQLWSLSEHPGKRWVFAMDRATLH